MYVPSTIRTFHPQMDYNLLKYPSSGWYQALLVELRLSYTMALLLGQWIVTGLVN